MHAAPLKSFDILALYKFEYYYIIIISLARRRHVRAALVT